MLSLDLNSAHHDGIKWTQFLEAETHKYSYAFSDETRETFKDFMTLGCERELTDSINIVDRWPELTKTRHIISVDNHVCIWPGLVQTSNFSCADRI